MSPTVIFVFETTHQAMWAEEVAREGGIPAEVVSPPAGVEGKCGLALETLAGRADELASELKAAGVPFGRLAGTSPEG